MYNSDILNLPSNTLCVSSGHYLCGEGNKDHLNQLKVRDNVKVHDCWALHCKEPEHSEKRKQFKSSKNKKGKADDTNPTESFKPIPDSTLQTCDSLNKEKLLQILNAADILDDKSKQVTHLQLCIGARVLITSNLGISLGLMNGTLGTVVGFLYGNPDSDSIPHFSKHTIMPECPTADMAAQNQPALPIVLVQIDEIYSKLTNSYLKDASNIVPIAPISREITWGKEEKIYRTQLPLILAKFATIHKIQGVSVDHLVWILGPTFAMGLSYVAMSRVTSLNGLFIIPSQKNQSPSKI